MNKDEQAALNRDKLRVIERHEAEMERMERTHCAESLANRRQGESYPLRWVARAGLYEVRSLAEFDALSRREFAGLNRVR